MLDWQERYKEVSPKETIERIDNILKENGFRSKFVEMEKPEGINCFSCRFSIIDENGNELAATNGKGMSRELSKASAYGEMMERVSNLLVGMSMIETNKNGIYLDCMDNCVYDMDFTKKDMVNDMLDRIVNSSDNNGIFRYKKENIITILSAIQRLSKDGKWLAKRTYSVFDKEYINMPDWMGYFIGSNGMAAGNTYEEAIVEAISEIFERKALLDLYDGKYIPPLMDRKDVFEYPRIKEIIEELERDGKYHVNIYDCSMGMGFPNVCGVIVEKDTGRFAIKLGSHPILSIALERVFTEVFQGRSDRKQLFNNYIRFFDSDRRNDRWNMIKIGFGSVEPSFFAKKPTYEYKKWIDLRGKTNHELMNYLLSLFKKIDKKVYVRNVAYLGFPAVLVYVPDFSEANNISIYSLRELKLITDVLDALRHIDQVSDDEKNKICTLCKISMFSYGENTINNVSKMHFKNSFFCSPAELFGLYILIKYSQGKYIDAINMYTNVRRDILGLSEEDSNMLSAIHTYICAKETKVSDENLENIINTLFPNIAKQVFELLSDKDTILTKVYKRCDIKDCENCDKDFCYQSSFLKFFTKCNALYWEKMPKEEILVDLFNE